MVVSSKTAEACMSNYETIVKGSDLKAINSSFSTSINFATPELAEWLNTNGYLKNSVSIRICPGIYTEAVVKELNLPEKYIGRLTAFIWPEKPLDAANLLEAVRDGANGDDDPDYEPFNLADLKP